MQRDLRERPAALHPLPGHARPPRPVPQLPAHHHQGRGQVREEVSGHDHDRGEDGDGMGRLRSRPHVSALTHSCRLSAANQRRRGRGGLLQRQGLLQRHAGADGREQGGCRGEQPAQVTMATRTFSVITFSKKKYT